MTAEWILQYSCAKGLPGGHWGSSSLLFHPFWWLCLPHLAHPGGGHRPQIFPPCTSKRALPSVLPLLSSFLRGKQAGGRGWDFWTFPRTPSRNSTNTYWLCQPGQSRVPRLSVKAKLFYLLFFTPLQVPAVGAGGVEDRKAAARCQIFPQTLLFFKRQDAFFLLQFQAVASSLKMHHTCNNSK